MQPFCIRGTANPVRIGSRTRRERGAGVAPIANLARLLCSSGPICVCPAFVGAHSSPRHFQQDLAATEEMLHRVLDMLEGVHAPHGDNEGAVGY
jgi:hypothetical protein